MRVLKPFYLYKKQLAFGAVATLVILLFINILTMNSRNSAKATGEGSRILTVYNNGERTSFKTNSKTVREALKEQKIDFSKEDSVEPSLDDELTGTEYKVNIYKAKPLIIEDGGNRIRIMTAAQTPQQITKAANIKLYNEDKIDLTSSSYSLEDGLTPVLKIQRANVISVDLYGKKTEFRTQAKTVSDFLKEKQINLGNEDGISINQNTELSNGFEFKIWRNGKQTITVEEEVSFKTETIQDANKDSGYKEVKTAGQKGAKNVTYEVEMRNGQEVSRKKISEAETKAAKNEVVIVGTKSTLPSGSHEDWMASAGISASDYGYVNYIVTHESTWRPTASNGQYYGLYQTTISRLNSHGCSGSSLSNPICQLKSATIYATSRYGSWAAAYAYWKSHGSW